MFLLFLFCATILTGLLNLKNSDSFLFESYNCIPNITFLFMVIPFSSNSCPLCIKL